MRSANRLLLGAMLLALLSVGAKLGLSPRNIYPDRERLAQIIDHRLSSAGFSVSRSEEIAPYRLRATRGDCRLAVQQVDVEAAERSAFARRTRTTGPLRFHYRGQVTPEFPRFFPVLADQAQRQTARLGLVFAVAPIIAFAASPACSDPAPLFTGLRIEPKPGPSAIRGNTR